jgi:hypothetical protein
VPPKKTKAKRAEVWFEEYSTCLASRRPVPPKENCSIA